MGRSSVLLWVLVSVLFAADTPAQPGSPLAAWSQLVGRLEQTPGFSSAQVGFSLLQPDGSVLFGHQEQKAFIPASTLKAVITAAALDVLGPEHRFRTQLVYDGSLQDSVLNGNLWIIGEGDPSLGSNREELLGAAALLKEWVAAIRAAGIRRIEGQVIGDGRFYGAPEVPGGWAWDDLGNYYAPVLTGLTLDENRSYLTFNTPEQVGAPAALLRVEPNLPGWLWINECRSGNPGSGDECYLYAAPGLRTIYARGTLPPGRPGFSVEGSWPDPDLAAAQRLVLALEAAGCKVKGGAVSALLPPEAVMAQLPQKAASAQRSPGAAGSSPAWKERPDSLSQVWVGYSPALGDLVRWTNEKSLNGYAESFLRALGQKDGDPSINGGRKALKSWLKERPQISDSGWNLNDGSGLSRRNTVTPLGMANLMVWCLRQSWGDVFYQSLPRSGQSGTLRNLLPNEPGRIAAKSGSLNGTRAYVGFATGISGQRYPFCITVNHAEAGPAALRTALEPLFNAMLALP